MIKNKLSFSEFNTLAAKLAAELDRIYKPDIDRVLKIYAIPRGGVPAALAVAQHIPLLLVDGPEQADLFIDDILDGGATRDKWKHDWPEKNSTRSLTNKLDAAPQAGSCSHGRAMLWARSVRVL
ncbi:phosphoribosyltransferase [Sinorhizobium psoraleae]|uniref:Phosphoribosyltransferase n=1 Tax=Sinorhizobium psoraleae TaxID=520838 RepID=A0ABT4KNM3_9HYPH|nr:phosphoribosyltransferase [Sinorhizobium psoraleae]MCZ4093565.1 phosphoribosyltransferase [Sinorhizobium psoraleae]